jgi:hypothetical protein
MDTCATGKLGAAPMRLDSADRLIAIGSDGMMGAVARERSTLPAERSEMSVTFAAVVVPVNAEGVNARARRVRERQR